MLPSFASLIIHAASMFLPVTGETLTVKSTTDFDLDGTGGAKEWKPAEWITLEKNKGAKTYSTRVKLLYSETGIYGLFFCEDEKITATKTQDFTDLWKEDVIEIFFWTDESTPLYFEYELSPLNYELAILVPNFNGEFLGWRPWQYEGNRKTRHAVKINHNPAGNVTSWTAEFFIPYRLMKPLQKVPPQKGTYWRVNMYRIDYDEGPTSWVWQPVRTNFHDYESFGKMIFN